MEVKEHIIQQSLSLFLKKGVKQVNMDEVATNYNPEAYQNSYTGQVAPTSCNAFYPSDYNYFGIDLDYYNANLSVFAIGTEISVGGYSYYIDGTSTPNN